MAAALPNFPDFDTNTDPSTLGVLWKKWLARFCNLLLAIDVTDKKRQRALLLHYAGEGLNEIFDTLPDTTAGEDENPFEKAVEALTTYFTPKKNREYEIYVFRQAKQETNENITTFHTRLRKLATTCEFENDDREIKTQIVQNCTSHKLRTKALERPELSLSQLLDIGKAMELSKLQAANIEDKQEALKVSKVISNRGRNRHSYKQNQDGGRAIQNPKTRHRKLGQQEVSNRKSQGKCRNCGRDYPHQGGKTL